MLCSKITPREVGALVEALLRYGKIVVNRKPMGKFTILCHILRPLVFCLLRFVSFQ